MKCVCIFSGGLDSTTLLYELIHWQHEVHPISFHYGQKHAVELTKAALTCAKLGLDHKIVDIGFLGQFGGSSLTTDTPVPEGNYTAENMKSTVVPNRNMIMISIAVAYAISIKAIRVYYGAHAGDHAIYPDCRPKFLKPLCEAVYHCDWERIGLDAPYLYFDKAEILKRGLKLGVDYKLTQTCYNGREKACGKCGSCIERKEAFTKNGIPDPIEYES